MKLHLSRVPAILSNLGSKRDFFVATVAQINVKLNKYHHLRNLPGIELRTRFQDSLSLAPTGPLLPLLSRKYRTSNGTLLDRLHLATILSYCVKWRSYLEKLC